MSEGVRIAKPGATVNSGSASLYVDTTTPLFKVDKLVTGALVSDGTHRVVNWTGENLGSTTDDTSHGYSFQLKIPHYLGYIPTFLAYADLMPSSLRSYITGSSQGIATTGSISASCQADENYFYLNFFPHNPTGTGTTPPPPAGTYGFAIYIFYDELGPLK